MSERLAGETATDGKPLNLCMAAQEVKAGTPLRMAGQATSPGLAKGHAFVHRNLLDALSAPHAIHSDQVAGEFGRVDRALEAVLADLKISALRIETQAGPKLAAIFGVHEAMLEDSSLRDEIRMQIEGQLIGAAQALASVFRRWQDKFRSKPQQLLQERADDLADLEGRLLREIAGVRTTALEKMPPGRVLVAHRLLPSETVALPQLGVVGIVLEFGGLGSHAALLARALGIPTVAQIPNALTRIVDGDQLIVDGFEGKVILHPDASDLGLFEDRSKEVQTRSLRARELAAQPARTADGLSISVMANVGSREDVMAAREKGADGIGLYRMEQFYLARTTPPSEEDLIAELRTMFEPVLAKPITVRLLDLGADKPVSFLNFPIEDDPFLGCRGVRLLLRYPDLLDTQLKALLRFSEDHDLRILVPMITLASEMATINQRLKKIAQELGITAVPPLGAMIETPAAALCVRDIVQHADFLSIGTNDLTQYTMAAGRENPLVNEYFQEDHPAVLRLIRMVVEEAGAIPVAICGELAGQLDCTATLLRLGVRHLSAAPPLVPQLKETVRSITVESDCPDS